MSAAGCPGAPDYQYGPLLANWLVRVLASFFSSEEPVRPSPPAAAHAQVSPAPATELEPPPALPRPQLAEEHAVFLDSLVHPPGIIPIDDLAPDDRAFVAGVLKRWHKRELALPVMPAAALRLSQLLRDGAKASDFAALIEQDPSLGVEVLRVANSPMYPSARPVTSLKEAVIRIGLTRLQAILMTSHLKARVLKGGAFKMEAQCLLELGLPIAILASRVARRHDADQDTCFMRGVLMHVEHLVVVSSVQEVSRELRRVITPSSDALHQALCRFGRDVREAVASAWSLTDLLLGTANEPDIAGEYGDLRQALVHHWTGRPLPRVEGIEPAALARAVADLQPPAISAPTARTPGKVLPHARPA